MFENTAGAVWSSRPSIRAAAVSLAAVVVMGVCVVLFAPFWIQRLVEATPAFPWTAGLIFGLRYALWAVVGLGVVWNLWRILLLWSQRYEMTPERFIYHHGILLRQQDEIELRRIRDFRVLRPIMSRSLGLGTIHILSRDATNPDLFIGPFVDARAVQERIRKAVVDHQAATGYREFDSGV
jgi:uncharacterized membrane protein YdbT with pleckstrin-like domain